MKAVFAFLFVLIGQFFYAQQTDRVDFESLKGEITLSPQTKTVDGQVEFTFTTKTSVDSIYIDAKSMTVSLSKDSPQKIKLRNDQKKVWLIHSFKGHKTYTVKLDYTVKNPQKTLYFVGWDNAGSNQIWSQGQGHQTSYWLPGIDDKNDKMVFELTYKVPKDYEVIANGKLIDHHAGENHSVWHYKMTQPMSSYLVAVAVGHYRHKTLRSEHGTPLKLYYEPEDSSKFEPTYRYSKKIFDDMENEIGVSYPWVNYKQIPVRDFLYAGMENTTATIFSESFMTDSIGFIDRNYVNVNAHELAHQWFGDMVTEKSSKSHWLQEGFANYYALLTEKKIFGDDDYYYKLYESAEKLKAQSDKGRGKALTDPEAGSLTFYQKGAWALHILREKIGDKAFRNGIQSYLETYKFKTVSTGDFIKEMEDSSGKDLSDFVERWINQSAFQAKKALKSLRKSSFIGMYLDLAALRQKSLKEKYNQLDKALDFPVNKYLGQEVVHQLAKAEPSNRRHKLLKKALATNNTLVRQAVAVSLTKIPTDLQSKYEDLLEDPSYLTQEKALFNLWKNFPSSREKYLNTLQKTQGFYNKNIRMMWLTLALVTQNYRTAKNGQYFKELSSYTAPAYDYSIRKNAFGHLYQINTFTNQNYKDLMQACVHPVWRFRKFARELLDALLKENAHRDKLQLLKPQLPNKQQQILETKTN